MKANRLNQLTDNLVQTEIDNLYTILNKIAFGTTTNQRCENLDAYLIEITAVSGTDVSASHDLKRTPSNWLQVWTNVSGTTYESSSGVSANSDTTAWFRATVTGNYRLVLI